LKTNGNKKEICDFTEKFQQRRYYYFAKYYEFKGNHKRYSGHEKASKLMELIKNFITKLKKARI
jgi:hypothetical protein